MAEIRIVAENGGGGGGTPPPSSGYSGSGGTGSSGATPDNGRMASSYIPDNNRLTEEYRKLLQQQGGVVIPGSANARTIFRQFETNQRDMVTNAVRSDYDERRASIRDKYAKEREEQNLVYRSNIEDLREEQGGRLDINSKEFKAISQENADELKRLSEAERSELKSADEDEKKELTAALNALTNILKDVKESSERESESGASQSYLGRLKSQRSELLRERENAATEEEAIAASRRIAELDEKMGRVFNTRRTSPVASVFDSIGSITSGMSGVMGSLSAGDLAGGVMGTGSTVAGVLGSAGAMTAAAVTAGITAAVAAAVKGAVTASENYNAVSTLASFRSTSGATGQNAVNSVLYALNKTVFSDIAGNEIKFTDFDMNANEFAKRAEQNVKTRGTGENWYAETIRQIGLERQFGLQSGALAQGAQFDRYGQTVTQSITTLVDALNRRGVEGANMNDFSRVQEKFDFQQALMQSYLSRNDRPNYDVANRAVVAMNAVEGITHDRRDVSDYQTIQNAIQNPMNDRMKALVYSTVQDIMPELVDFSGKNFSAADAGRLDRIDQAIKNSANETQIMQAVIKRIEQTFGGLNTQMGYFAFTNVFRGISVDRLQKIMTEFGDESSDAGKVLRGEEPLPEAEQTKFKMDAYVTTAIQYTAELTRETKKIANMFSDLMNQVAVSGYGAIRGGVNKAMSGE